MLILYLSTMLLCLGIECWPALAGVDTIPGNYPLTLMPVDEPEYKGSVLAYRETDTIIYSIHRTYPGMGREKMYTLPDEKRRHVTNGCINIEPYAYERLMKENIYQLEIIP